MSTVSVVVPVFNVKDRLSYCLESLALQTYKDLEIILINDGSNDGSEKICQSYSEKYPNIKLINITNSGASRARNIGINEAKSTYILFVDADDYVDKYLVEGLVTEAKSSNLDFVMSGYYKCFINPSKEVNIKQIHCREFSGDIKEFLGDVHCYLDNPLLQGPCWKLFKKEIINSNDIFFPEDMSFGEDALFVYEYLKHVSSVRTIDKPLYYYNIYGNSTLSSVFREDKYELKLLVTDRLKNLLEFHDVLENKDYFYKIICNHYINSIGNMWYKKNRLTREKRYEIIENMNAKVETKEAFKQSKNDTLQIKYLYFLIFSENTKTIDRYFAFKESVKYFLRLLFNKTRRRIKEYN